MHFAVSAKESHADIVQSLLAAGANPNYKEMTVSIEYSVCVYSICYYFNRMTILHYMRQLLEVMLIL